MYKRQVKRAHEDLRVFRQFEDAENSKHSDEREATTALSRLTVALSVLHQQDDEVWQDGQQVDDVHEIQTEMTLRRTRHKADDELTCEPTDARLHTGTA